jgi:hypothetical protein
MKQRLIDNLNKYYNRAFWSRDTLAQAVFLQEYQEQRRLSHADGVNVTIEE